MANQLQVAELQSNIRALAADGLNPAKWGLEPSNFFQLANYDLPQRMVIPLLLMFRHINTIADSLFYDVNLLWFRLYTRGVMLTSTNSATPALAREGLAALQTATRLNLSALANPEGAILVVDAHHAPFVHKYEDVRAFLADGATFPASNGGNGIRANQRDYGHRCRQLGAGFCCFRMECIRSAAAADRGDRTRLRPCRSHPAGARRLVRLRRPRLSVPHHAASSV